MHIAEMLSRLLTFIRSWFTAAEQLSGKLTAALIIQL